MNEKPNVGGFVVVAAIIGLVAVLYARGTFESDPSTPALNSASTPSAQQQP